MPVAGQDLVDLQTGHLPGGLQGKAMTQCSGCSLSAKRHECLNGLDWLLESHLALKVSITKKAGHAPPSSFSLLAERLHILAKL